MPKIIEFSVPETIPVPEYRDLSPANKLVEDKYKKYENFRFTDETKEIWEYLVDLKKDEKIQKWEREDFMKYVYDEGNICIDFDDEWDELIEMVKFYNKLYNMGFRETPYDHEQPHDKAMDRWYDMKESERQKTNRRELWEQVCEEYQKQLFQENIEKIRMIKFE